MRRGRRAALAAGGPLEVLLLLEGLDFGGTQRQAIELAGRLDRGRYRVEIGLLAPEAALAPLAAAHRVPLRSIHRRRPLGPAGVLNLWRHLRAAPIDILLLLTVVPNIWGRMLGRLAGIPLVIGTCRGGASPRRQHDWLLWPLADHHVANTRQLARILVDRCRLPPSRVSVIANGVDSVHFSPAPPAAVEERILCAARLVPDKGHEILLAAFGRLLQRHPAAELWLLGDGPRRDALARLVARAPLAGRVRLIPAVPDPRPYYHRASLFVLASQREGMPNALLEAMACRLPAVATDIGGVAELLRHGETGLLVRPGDPEALAEAMARLLADPPLRRAMGAAARRRAAAFSLEAMARGYEALFTRLLAGRGGRKRGCPTGPISPGPRR